MVFAGILKYRMSPDVYSYLARLDVEIALWERRIISGESFAHLKSHICDIGLPWTGGKYLGLSQMNWAEITSNKIEVVASTGVITRWFQLPLEKVVQFSSVMVIVQLPLKWALRNRDNNATEGNMKKTELIRQEEWTREEISPCGSWILNFYIHFICLDEHTKPQKVPAGYCQIVHRSESDNILASRTRFSAIPV